MKDSRETKRRARVQEPRLEKVTARREVVKLPNTLLIS